MTEKMTRRDALKWGTSAAVSATVSPLLRSAAGHAGKMSLAWSETSAESTVMPLSTENEICFLPAEELAGMIREKKVSSREVMQAHLKQIARVNPKVNAIVTLVPEEKLMAQALAADEAIAKGHWLGPVHGLSSLSGRKTRAPSSLARRTCRSGVWVRKRSIRCSGRR